MGWFDEQIKERRKRDQDNFADAMDELSSVITRKPMGSGARNQEASQRSQVEWAVGKILEYYHLDPSQAIAFGDNHNDMEMLEAVGTGVAMGNATQQLKDIADDICGAVDQDGVYRYCVARGLI